MIGKMDAHRSLCFSGVKKYLELAVIYSGQARRGTDTIVVSLPARPVCSTETSSISGI